MRCGKKCFLLLVALLFLLSATSWAEVCLSDDEYEELQEIFSELKTQSLMQGRELRMAQIASKKALTELMLSEIALESAGASLIEAQQSLRQQRFDTIAVVVISVIAAGLGGFSIGTIITR